MSPSVRRFAIAGLVLVIAAAGVLVFSRGDQPGLEGIPAMSADELAATKDADLLARVQTDISRRAGRDWRKLPEAQRHLLAIGALEDGLARSGFLAQVLAERSGGVAARPQLSELAASYRWLDLPAAADAIDAVLAVRDREDALLAAWAAYDISDPGRGPQPKNPFTAADAAFRAAARGSPAKRIAWIRGHADDVLAP